VSWQSQYSPVYHGVASIFPLKSGFFEIKEKTFAKTV
jgi:hypothetical protein